MTNTFAVDTARIAAASGDIERIAATIETEVRAMMAKLTALDDCQQRPEVCSWGQARPMASRIGAGPGVRAQSRRGWA